MSFSILPVESERLQTQPGADDDAYESLWRAHRDHLEPWLLARGAELPGSVHHAVRTRAHGTLVGGVITAPLGSAVEISYWLAREFTGHGFAREAVSAVVEAVLARASFVVIRCNASNIRGAAVAAACGFTRVAGDNVRQTWTRVRTQPVATADARRNRSRPGLRLLYLDRRADA